MRLTDISVSALREPKSGQKTYHDSALPGFGVRISQGGTKAFVLVHGRDRRRTTIGRYPTVSLQEARYEAKRLLAEETLGKHRPKRMRFEATLEQFVASHLKQKNKPTTAKNTEALIRNHFPSLKGKTLEDIRTDDITRATDRLLAKERPGSANHAFTAIKTFLRWCVRRRYLPHSPIEGLEMPARPGTRDRVLSDTELTQILTVARDAGAFDTFVLLLALTGQRRAEIALLHNAWIDRDGRQTITWPKTMTKNKREHTMPLGAMASEIVATLPGEGLLFPAVGSKHPMSGFSKAKALLDVKLKKQFGDFEHWQLHDLRRTFSTGLARLGVLPHVKETLLNHTSAKTDVERIYDRYQYLPEMRAAIALWENHVACLLNPAILPKPE